MPATPDPKHGLFRPSDADPINDGAAAMRAIVDGVAAIIATAAQGTLAAIPAAGKSGRFYHALDTGQLFYDDGTTWRETPLGPGQRRESGEYKYAVDTADHGALGGGQFAWLLADDRETPAGYTALINKLTAAGNPFGTGPSGRPRLPDLRGRMPVAAGTHAEVNALGDSDGLAVGSRKVKHRHGPGTLSLPRRIHLPASGPFDNYSHVPGVQATSSGDQQSSSGIGGEVGDTAGPLDGPAFLVAGNWFVKT